MNHARNTTPFLIFVSSKLKTGARIAARLDMELRSHTAAAGPPATQIKL